MTQETRQTGRSVVAGGSAVGWGAIGPAAPGSWAVVAILMGYSFMTWFNRVSMETAGARIMDAGLLSETQMGTVYSSFFFLYTLCMTPGGWLSDRFGPRFGLIVMGFGSAVFGAGTGLVGMAALTPAALLWALWTVRGAMGMFTAPIYPSSGRLIAHWIPLTNRASVNGLVQGSASVGIASTYYVFGWMSDRWGWPKSLLLTAGVTAGLAILLVLFVSDWPRGAQPHLQKQRSSEPVRSQPWDWLSLLRNRSLLCLTFSYAAIGYFEYLFFFWMRHYFEKELHMSKADSRFYAIFPPLIMAVCMPLGGWLADRLSRGRGTRHGRMIVCMSGMLLSAGLLLGGIVAVKMQAEPASIVVWFSLALGAIGAVEGPTWATAIDLGRRHGSTAAGICNTGGNAGGTLAPSITPWVGTRFGWNYSLLLSCLVCLVGVVLWIWVDPEVTEAETAKA